MSKSRKRTKQSELVLGKALKVTNEEEYKLLEKAILGTGNDIYEGPAATSESEDEDENVKKKKISTSKEKQPAWVDEEDQSTLNEVLQKQDRKPKVDASGRSKHQTAMEKKFKEIMGVPKWAQMPKERSEDVDDLLRTCGEFIKKPKGLNKDLIEITKVKNLNKQTNCEGPIISVLKFHPKSMVAIVGGNAGMVSIVQVDGTENAKLQTLQFQKYPIYTGSFMKGGDEFLIGSKFYKYFYSHNLITGKSVKVDTSKITEMTKTKNFCVSPRDDYFAVAGNTGKIYLFTVATKEFVDWCQMNCEVTALSFNGDGSILYSHGTDGVVYAWDMGSRRCISKFVDDGCLTGTALASSKNTQFLACGSSSGVVNVYGPEHLDPDSKVQPMKTIFNLVTPITNLKFNSTGEILALGSNQKEGAVKLLHCSSMTVFSNFPPLQCPFKKPMTFDFSVNSGFFAIGDNAGSAHLYRLKHYGDY